MIINARFEGSVKCTSAGAVRLGLVVLGRGRVVERRSMPDCSAEPWEKGQVKSLNPAPEAKGVMIINARF